ncbi:MULTISPECIES: organic hydroperoxide resistance protein [Marinococcus]|uniref:organic hydroperoxide resistance protein n=1 Tax=Marinococcus TaxID=1370 RepID=UPI0026350A83|nr:MULTISPECIES: organic hydroperoxide resistance protein [Marinococcus]MDX6153547.1 organic hydroperoxide resistance protein [Marinococcus sp. PL1-022]MDZ5783225.1 organic hydroperoxide resistance protein [Marinococcus luteus]
MAETIFTSKATVEGGREGHVRSEDGMIDVNLEQPGSGSSKSGSNPEQLFASGYAACFDGMLNLQASKKNKDVSSKTTAAVSLQKDESDGMFQLAAELTVEISGVSKEEADELVDLAHQYCPYSKATRNNIEVKVQSEVK